MKALLITIGIIVAIVIISVIAAISIRNGLIERDEGVKAAWSQIDTQLQRRADLIPNLVNTVKGYAAHEEKIFTEIADARSRLLAAKGPAAKAEAGAMVESALGRLLAIAENYPTLKANENFIRLQDELAGTENRISVARTRYNDTAREFNASIRKFPGSLFASGLGRRKEARRSRSRPPCSSEPDSPEGVSHVEIHPLFPDLRRSSVARSRIPGAGPGNPAPVRKNRRSGAGAAGAGARHRRRAGEA